MAARTGRSTTIPGVGTITRGKSGKAKTFTGKGPAPAGTRKVRPKTAATSPTLTVSRGPTGTEVTTSNFASPNAAARARAAQQRSSARVRRIERQVAQAAAIASAGRRQRRASKPRQFQGHPTAGEPTLRELKRADAKGTLGENRKGSLTTPKIRQTSAQLRAAMAAASKSGKIEGIPHGGESEQFAEALAQATHLDPHFVGAWVTAEGAGESGSSGGEAGKNNWLGVGYPAHRTSFSESPFFAGSGRKGGRATADWIKGKIGGEYDYAAAQGIKEIIPKAAGKGPEAALRALEESGWGTNVDSVRQDLGMISVKPANPKAVKRLRSARAQAKAVGLNPKPKPASGAVAKPAWMLEGGPKNVKHAVQILGAAPLKKWLKPTNSGTAGYWRNIADLNPVLARQLVKLAKATGEPIVITSGYRSVEDQEAISSGTNPKAPPGLSAHQFGMAADSEMSQRQAELAPKFGLEHGEGGPGVADPPHTELTDLKLIREAMKYGPIRSGYAPLGWQSEGDLGSFSMPADLAEGGASYSSGGSSAVSGAAPATGSNGGTTAPGPKGKGGRRGKQRLTTLQRYNRNKRKLRSLGVPIATGRKAPKEEAHPVLQELIEKYGSGNPVPTAAAERKAKALAAAGA